MFCTASFLLSLSFGTLYARADSDSDEQDEVEIVVTATKTEVDLEQSTISVDVISSKEIASFGIGDLTDVLQQLSGVQIERSILGSSPALQGLSPKHTLVLVNGQRLLGSKNGVIDLARISTANIDRIEIIRGASSVLYGSDAMGGVINVITKQPTSKRTMQGTYQHGSFGMIQADGYYSSAHPYHNSISTLSVRNSDGFDLDEESPQTDGPAFRQVEISNQTQWNLLSNLTIDGHAGYLFRDSTRVNGNGLAVYDQANRIEDANVRLNPIWKPTANSKVSTVVSGTLFREQYIQDQRRAVDYDMYQENIQKLGVFQIQHDYALKEHVLTQGLEAQVEHVQTPRLVDGEATRNRVALFIQDQSYLQELPIQMNTGLRLDMDSWFGPCVTPKIAFRFDPTPFLYVRGSYGMGYRAPSFKEMFLYFNNAAVGYVVEGNPDLLPERSQSLQTEIEVSLPKRLRFNIQIFRNDLDNLISVLAKDSSTLTQMQWEYANITKAFTAGVHGRSIVNVTEKLSFTGSYNFLNAVDLEQQRFLEGKAVHSGAFGIRLSLSSGTLVTGNASFMGKRVFYLDQDGDGVEDSVFSDPYSMLNIRIAQQVGTYTQVFLGIQNILNQGDTTYLPIQPRWMYAGARFRKQKG